MFTSLLCYRNGSNKIHTLVTNHYYIDSNISICQILFFTWALLFQTDKWRWKQVPNSFQHELSIWKNKVTSPMEKVTSSVKSLVWMISGNINSSHLTGYVIEFILDRAGLERQCFIPGDQKNKTSQSPHQVPARSLFSKANLNCLAISLSQFPIWTPKEWFLIFFA